MSASRLIRYVRPSAFSISSVNVAARPFGTTAIRSKDLNDRAHPNVSEHRDYQTKKPLNPHITNTTSTQTNDFPRVGEKSAPPDLISSVDPNYKPVDPYPGKIQHFTGGRQEPGTRKPELGVGEIEGVTFKVEPLRRSGEDATTMRARLLYQSRKRGILETDLLLSTFADAHLADMAPEQLTEYDLFLDENDWDIYYWATQDPEGPEAAAAASSPSKEPKDVPTEHWQQGAAKSGEWAQTIGAFKPAYRPVPSRWIDSWILNKLRDHVRDKSALGFHAAKQKKTGGGLGRMPNVRIFE